MERRDPELTPILDAARRRRMDLHQALVEVEQAISAPAPGRVDDWGLTVGKMLVHLRDAFHDHVVGTEEQGGLYDEILERAPHLTGKVKRLRDEHPVIADQIAQAGSRFEAPDFGDDEETVAELRDDAQRLLGRIVRHRQHGADLVWEAYNLDIGGMG